MMFKSILVIVLAGSTLIIGLLTYNMPLWRVQFLFSDIVLDINIAILTAALLSIGLVLVWLIKLMRLPFAMKQTLHNRREAYATAEMNRGVTLYMEGQLKSARKHLLNAAKTPAFEPAASLLTTHCALRENQLYQAHKALEKARRSGANPFVLSLLQAEMLIAENKLLQARNLLEELSQTQPDNDQVLQLLAQAYSAESSYLPAPDANDNDNPL